MVWTVVLLIIDATGPQSLVLVSVKIRVLIYPPQNVASSVNTLQAVYIAKAQHYEEIPGLAVNKVSLQCK